MFRTKTDGKIQSLRDTSAFSTLADSDLEQLAALADLMEIPGETVLMEEGHRGAEVFLIVEGAVAVTHGDEEIAQLGPGDFVGELALIDDQPRSATVTTTRVTRVLVFDPRTFDRMIQTNPTLTRRLLKQVSARLREPANAQT